MKSFMCMLFIIPVRRIRNKSYRHQQSIVVKLSDFYSNVLQCRLIFIRLSGKVAHALLVKMKYNKNRYGLLVFPWSKLHISALYKLTESVQSLSKFLLVKSPGLPRPGCKCIAFYWSLQRSAAQWLPLDWSRTLWWRYTTSFIHNHDFRYVDI